MKLDRGVALALCACAAGCGGGEAARVKPQIVTAPSGPAADVAGSWSPAHWAYHPAAPDAVTAHVRLSDGSCVLVAEGGQRWTTTPLRRGGPAGGDDARCAGAARASSVLAPEELTGVFRRSQTSWAFVGAGGTLYETSDALGPFARVTPPPEPLLEVVSGGSSLVALTRGGRLLHFRDDRGWSAANELPLPVFDVAMTEGGHGLALALPEALFVTADGGVTWRPPPDPAPGPVGAGQVGQSAAGALVAEGVLASIVWDARRSPSLTRASEVLAPPPEAVVVAGRTASSAAVLFGRAQIDDDRYYEVVRHEGEGEAWVLARGSIEGRLETVPLAWTDECGSIKLGARGAIVATACVRMGEGELAARIRRSVDGGSTWKDLGDLPTPDTDLIAIGVAPDGSLLVTGVCEPSPRACTPGGPVLLPASSGKRRALAAAVPGLGSPTAAPAFGPDGRRAYVLGRRAKDDEVALFVSHDGGESFAERALQRPVTPSRARALSEAAGEDGEDAAEERLIELELGEGASIQVGDDGAVGVTLANVSPAVHFVTDEDGRVLSMASPPLEDAVIAAFGRRVLAVAPRDAAADMAHRFGVPISSEGLGTVVWESLDGGTVWNEVPSSLALSREHQRGAPSMACGSGGCLVGDTIARVGWGGQGEVARGLSPADPPEPTRDAALRAPIVCELAPSSRWTRIDHVYASHDGGMPDEDESMRGLSVWSVLTYDPAVGALDIVSATLPASGEGAARVETRPLLGRLPAGVRAATRVAPQMEGYAAARVRFAGKAEPAEGAPMPRIEVAWENFMEGVSGRRALDGAGSFDPRDVSGDTYPGAFVSVSPGGVFVRPHAGSTSTYFLDFGKGVTRFAYPAWPTAGVGGDLVVQGGGDAVLVGGAPIGVGFVEARDRPHAQVVMLARRDGDAWEVTAKALAPDLERFESELEWTYAGASLGVTTLVTDRAANRAWAYFNAFGSDGAFGPPEPLPTPLDLPAQPRPCTKDERAATARTEASLFGGGNGPIFTGTRHPVIVTEAPAKGASGAAVAEPLLLLTSASVLHGTKAQPCVAAFRATGAGQAPVRAIIPGDPGHAWLFRPVTTGEASKNASFGRSIEVRPMTCRYDVAARVPDAVWREPGVFRAPR